MYILSMLLPTVTLCVGCRFKTQVAMVKYYYCLDNILWMSLVFQTELGLSIRPERIKG